MDKLSDEEEDKRPGFGGTRPEQTKSIAKQIAKVQMNVTL